MAKNKTIDSGAASDALDSVEAMQRAGYRRAQPPRWFGIGIALVIAIGFSLYAQKTPGHVPGLFIALGVALFGGYGRERIGVFGKEFPDTKTGWWALAALCLFLLTLFFGGIYIRRIYDLAWVPVATGLIAGLTILLLSESERRYYIAKGDGNMRQ